MQEIVETSHPRAYTKKCTENIVDAIMHMVVRTVLDQKRTALCQCHTQSASTRCDRSVSTASCARSEACDQLMKVFRVHRRFFEGLSLPVCKVVARWPVVARAL
jgi:hypothetical protein